MATTLFQKIGTTFMAVVGYLGSFFAINLTQGEALYNQLTPDEQQAAQWGSGVIHIFNSLAADFKAGKITIEQILQTVQTNFPTLDMGTLHGFLDVVNANVNIGLDALTIEQAAEATLSYLAKFETGVWGIISKAAAATLSILFTPETTVQKIEGALEFVYHLIVKPNVSVQVAAVVDTATGLINTVAPGSEVAGVANEAEQVVDAPPSEQTPSTQAETATDPDMQISNEAAAQFNAPTGTPPAAISFDEAQSAGE